MANKLLLATGVVFVFLLGTMFGWLVDGNMTADWVTAGGTWAGALGTVAAILWAVRTFSHQVSTETVEAGRRALAEEERARLVTVEVQTNLSAGVIQRAYVQVHNLSDRLVSVEAVDFAPSVVTTGSHWNGKKRDLPPNGNALKVAFEVVEYPPETNNLGLVVRYALEGVTWQRSPGCEPVRQ